MNAEQNAQFNKMDDEMEKVSAQIERRQKVEAAERQLPNPATRTPRLRSKTAPGIS